MTSIAFIAGVMPLLVAQGAGSEVRRVMGVTVFAGMLGVTFFGLFLSPVFYVALRRLAIRLGGNKEQQESAAHGAPADHGAPAE
jgi:Cu/Ag efflux pump CusA